MSAVQPDADRLAQDANSDCTTPLKSFSRRLSSRSLCFMSTDPASVERAGRLRISRSTMDEQQARAYTLRIVTEHAHLNCSRRGATGVIEVHTIVRRRFVDDEVAVQRQLGYDVDVRYCGDTLCLPLPEPAGEWRGGGSG